MGFLNYAVEVPLLLTFFTISITGPVYTNFIIYRTCYITLGYNQTECALLGNVDNNDTDKLEKLVEPHAATLKMVQSTIESIFSVTLCLFIGPWSDKFGRKPIMIINTIGFTLGNIGISILCYFENLSPWFSLVCSIPLLVTGGGASFITVILSYVTDITTEESRGIRMALFEAVFGVATLLGNLTSSYLFYATSYVSIFAIGSGFLILANVYIIFVLKESLQERETQDKVRSFFKISNMLEMVKTSIKRRDYYNRAIILLVITLLTIHIFAINGDGGLVFLYFREKFDWTLTKYTTYNSASSVAFIIGTMGGTYLLNTLFKIKEAILVLIGCISSTSGAILQGAGNKDWYLYAAALVRCLGGLISPMARSLVSKIVPADEIGKVFSMIMACEFFFGLGASPLYTLIYNSTINSHPEVFNYITAGIYMVGIILVIVIIVLQRTVPPNYTQLQQGESEEEGSTSTDNANYAIN